MPANILLECVGCALALVLVAAAAAAGSIELAAAGSLILGALGFVRLWLVLAGRARFWSFCDLVAGGLATAYFAGAAVTFLLSSGGAISYWSRPDLAVFLWATLYVTALFAVLRVLGAFERPVWAPVWAVESRRDPWPFYIAVALALFGAVQLLTLYTGAVSYAGTSIAAGANSPVGPSLVVALSWPIAGLCGWVLGRPELRAQPFLLLTACAMLPVQFLFAVAFGRRTVLFEAVLFATMFVWARGRGFRLARLLAVALPGLPVLYLLWMVFLGLRIDSYSDRYLPEDPTLSYGTRTLFARLDSTVDLLHGSWGEVERAQVQDFVDRVFIVGYLTDLMAGTRIASPFHGTEIVHQALMAVPRFLLPEKAAIAKGLAADEATVNQHFGLAPLDRASTVATSAYVNFLWLGPLIVPGLILVFGIAFAGTARLGGAGALRVYTLSYVLFLAMSVEESYITFYLNMLRVVLPLVLIVALVRLLRPRPVAAAAPVRP